jgi:hypothetical protein
MNIFYKLKLDYDIKIYTILYFLSFGLMLLNLNFIYWDDWTLVNQSKEDLINIFRDIGNPFFGYVHYFMIEYFGIYSYKILTFIFYFLSGLALNEILKRIIFLTTMERIFLVSVFLILPVNFARIAIITFPYAFAHLLFFSGFLLLSKYLNNKQLKYRVMSLILFFISFQINSFLVFYLVVFLYSLNIVYNSNIKILFFNIFKLIDFWILPFIFYAFKSLYLEAQGSHISYYAITKAKVISSFNNFWVFEKLSNEFWELLPSHVSIVGFIILFIIIYLILTKILNNEYAKNRIIIEMKKNIVLVTLGSFILYISIYPYLVVNTSPSYYDWDNRHMLLLPLGFSFLLTGCVNFLYLYKLKIIAVVFFLSIFISFNITAYYNYLIDGIKQDSIVYHMKKSIAIEKNNTFIIYDETKEYDALKRTYRFYEYTGMLDEVYGRQNKFATQHNRLISPDNLKNYLNPSLKLKNYKIETDYKKIYIYRNNLSLTVKNIIFLLYNKIFYNKKYEEMLNNILILHVK